MPETAETTPQIHMEPSAFASHHETFEIGESKYSARILKMNNSTLIYIGINGREFLDEIGIAMPVAKCPTDFISTVALGPQLGCDSEQLAQKLAKRLNKQIYVSCNVPFDRMAIPIMEKHLLKIIQQNPDIV